MLLPSSLGVDISPSRVSVMGIRQTLGRDKSLGQDVFPVDPHKPLSDQQAIINRNIAEFIRRHRLENASCYLGIPPLATIWRRITLPSAARENLADTIRYEAEKYLPIPLEELYWDYQTIEEDRAAGELTVLLVVIKRSDMAPYIELAEHLPGSLSGIEPALSAIANTFGRNQALVPHSDYALVVLTLDLIHFVHLRNGILQAGRAYPRPEAHEDLAPLLSKGLSALRLPTWHDTAKNGFPAVLETEEDPEALLAECRDSLPEYDWQTPHRDLVDFPRANMLAAYGLALSGLQKPTIRTNLLPLRLRKQPSRIGSYLTAALVLLTLLSAIAWTGSVLMQNRLRHARLDREIGRLADEVAAIENLQASIRQADAHLAYLDGQRRERGSVLEILKTLTEIIPASAWVRELAITPEGIRLDGYADQAAVLIPLIDASPMFTDVSFLSAITRGRDGKEKFRIGFKLVE